MIIRKIEPNELELLKKLRIDYQTAEKGFISDEIKQKMYEQLDEYFPKHFDLGDFVAAVCEVDGEVASVAFMLINERPSMPNLVDGKFATMINVLTYPDFRRKGYATMVVKFLLEEATKLGITVVDLSATEEGQPVYEKIGFAVSKFPSMKINLGD